MTTPPGQRREPDLADPDRLAALDETGLLGLPAEEAFDRFTRLASRLLGTPIAVINLITDDRQVVLSEVGLHEPWKTRRQTPLTHSFCKHMVDSGEPLILADIRDRPELLGGLGIEQFGVIAYAGVPLITSDDQVLGALCVTEAKPREWTTDEIDVLRDLAAAVMNEIELRVAQSRLVAERTFLEGVLENMQAAVIACDLNGVPLFMNDALRRMQGIDPEFELGDGALLRFASRATLYDADGQPMDRGTSPIFRALHGERTSGASFSFRLHGSSRVTYVETSASPIITPDGEHMGAVSVSHDVTEQRAAERAREEFFALVSHELRTPLAAITGYLELLEEADGANLSEDGRGFVRVLERNSERLLRLVGDLLFAAQVEAGSLALQIGDVDVHQLLDDAVESAQPLAAAAQLDLTCSIDDDARIRIPGDHERLAQVVDNLVSNALKFTPAGGSIVVGASRDAAGESLMLTVADTGIGIPAGEQSALFERFVRASAATEHAVQGVGLGLAISRAIVHGHDGEITLQSEEGVGTTFVVRLPATYQSDLN